MSEPEVGTSDEVAHSAEMGRRRELAVERLFAGVLFDGTYGTDLGFYCWIILSPAFYGQVLSRVIWRSDRSPGVRSERIQISMRQRRKILFRLRGIRPEQLLEFVDQATTLIGEFWPNPQREGFSGVTFVDPRRWRQDLVPSTDIVFALGLQDEVLYLDRAEGVGPPTPEQLARNRYNS